MRILRNVFVAAMACALSHVAAGATQLGSSIGYTRSGMDIDGQIINGNYDFTFRLFDAQNAGNQVGSTISINGINITNGVLPVQALDFGNGAFNGEERWVAVRARTGGAPFEAVGPRTRMLPVAYALALPAFRTDNVLGGAPNIIGGYSGNTLGPSMFGATISGGGILGSVNSVVAPFGTIGGGAGNTVGGDFGVVAGGVINTANGVHSAVGGGDTNLASGGNCAVPGGFHNVASGNAAAVGGGSTNIASGVGAVVPGGVQNNASGDWSFAAGRRAFANYPGAFVWGDSVDLNKFGFGPNSFTVHASGGAYFYSNVGSTTGVYLPPGSGSWSSVSDRTLKENVRSINPRAVLEQLVTLPVTTWNYIAQGPSTLHIGPMAQDFQAAFGVGEDDRHIASIDADGVLFAAVQGLHEMVVQHEAEMHKQSDAVQQMRDALAEKDAQIAEQARQISELRVHVERVQQLLDRLAPK